MKAVKKALMFEKRIFIFFIFFLTLCENLRLIHAKKCAAHTRSSFLKIHCLDFTPIVFEVGLE